MLHFILGRIRSGKTTYITEKIKERREYGTLFIVPEQISHSMERLLCERCGNTVSSYAEVTSFRRLAAKVKSEEGGLAAETVGGGRRILHLYSAVKKTAAALRVLGKTVSRPERLEIILAAIDEFKAYGVTPERLAAAAEEVNDNLAKKLSDLAIIYAAYEAELGEEETDAYDELKYIADILQSSSFFTDKTVYLDGFSGFTADEFNIIESAISKARNVYIALELPESPESGDENGIFDKTIKTKNRIEGLAQRCGVECESVFLPRMDCDALSYLDKMIFADSVVKYEETADEITVARAEGVFEECELAAAYILDKVSLGARFRDFSVAVADGTEYIGICERVFMRYGIPTYTSNAAELSSKPVIALIIAAFDCILRGFRTDSVMEYLKTGFSGVCARSLDIFENYLYTWSPKASEWSSGKEFTKNPFGLAGEEDEESRDILRTVNMVRRKVYEPINALASAMKRGKTGEKCAEALYDFINAVNLPRRTMAYSYLSELRGRLEEAAEYESLMKILCDVTDSIGRAVGDDEISVEELFMLFKLVVSQYELGTIPASLDCVSIASLERAEGERCKIRVILGADEGSFPQNGEAAGVLLDGDREELADIGIELAPGMTERTFEAYRTVHSVMCNTYDALYISSSAISRNGEERQEAPIVSRIRHMFSGIDCATSISEARLRAKVPCFDECVAAGKGLDFWGRDPEYSKKLSAAKENVGAKRGPILRRENIEAVFGKKIRLSASRADVFSSCRYEYFLKYGLNAKRREKAEITAIEAGNLMHYVLETVIAALSREGTFGAERAKELAADACREYITNTLAGTDELRGREAFILQRLEKTVKTAVEDICRELRKSEFVPREFELKFSGDGEGLPPLEIKGEKSIVLFRGAVDRVDMYESENELYFRVIDYKSGKKEFSLDEAINGIGMQMLLYMFALEEMGKERYGKEPKGAGVMYVPLAPKPSEHRGEKMAVKSREGVVLRDMRIIDAMEKGEKKEYLPVSIMKGGGLGSKSSVLTKREFDIVKDRMKSILARIGDELASGEIEPNPYTNKRRSACDWCDYKSVCAFDEERGNDRKRELIEVKVSDIAGGEQDE